MRAKSRWLENLTLRRDLRALGEHPVRAAAMPPSSGHARLCRALVPEIADSVADAVDAMRTGYNWKYGPFELIDRLGADWLAQALAEDGRPASGP